MPKVAKSLFLVMLFACLFGLFQTPAKAQDRGDPEGVLDSMYLECDADGLSGDTLVFKLRYHSDNTTFNKLQGLAFPVQITVSNNALILLDTSTARTFAGTAVALYEQKVAGTDSKGGADPTVSPVHFIIGAITFGTGVTGDSVFANIRLRVQSIATVITIDTMSNFGLTVSPSFTTEDALGFTPAWSPDADTCQFTDVRESKHPQGAVLPTDFALSQNYPNPFNATTLIQFALPRSSQVKLEIFNVLGQKVVTLVDEELQAGYKQVTWDGRDQKGNIVSSGIYFYRLRAGNQFTEMKKMVLIK
ncbi:MAG: hypothetical protein A2142_05975 [candidate division Zixibacteria bacterium RBG_16_48_11]|nr:MAG: hypothetical protein A2142_05975 [candidate division Zixibacteria bacterium RBG_16_48_11]